MCQVVEKETNYTWQFGSGKPLYRVAKHLLDLAFVHIKVGSMLIRLCDKAATLTDHRPAELFTNMSGKDSPRGARTPCAGAP